MMCARMATKVKKILVYTDGGVGASEHCVQAALAALREVLPSLAPQDPPTPLTPQDPPAPPAAQPSHFAIQCTTAEEILAGDWMESCGLLVMPGGRDLPYVARLQGRGNDLIRAFVKGGGGYLGLCAGGYYGASTVSFARGDPNLEVMGSRELEFFPGVAEGPTFPGFRYNCNAGARATRIAITPEGMEIVGRPTGDKEAGSGDLYVYYNGGCQFLPKMDGPSVDGRDGAGSRSNFHVLATYASDELPSSPSPPWAVVACKVGHGRVVLSGVHLETSPDTLRACHPGDEYIEPILPQLEVSKEQRQELFARIVKHLLPVE